MWQYARSSFSRISAQALSFPRGSTGGSFRHHIPWSVQQKIEFSAPEYLRNIIRIITETGLRVYKERVPMRKEHLDLENAMVWIPAMRIQTFIKNRSRQFGVSRYEGQVSGISGSTTYVRPTRSRLSAGGVADELTQLLRQGDAKVFKKYSQMKHQMKREALAKLNRQANESGTSFDTAKPN